MRNIECILVSDELRGNSPFADACEQTTGEEIIMGRQVTRQRCIECGTALLKLKSGDTPIFVDMPKADPCKSMYGRHQVYESEKYKPLSELKMDTQSANR